MGVELAAISGKSGISITGRPSNVVAMAPAMPAVASKYWPEVRLSVSEPRPAFGVHRPDAVDAIRRFNGMEKSITPSALQVKSHARR